MSRPHQAGRAMIGCVVVGGGPAGLAVSAALTDRGIEHVLLERGQVGETLRTLRWDSFRLNTPGWANAVLGDQARDHYATAAEVVGLLEKRAANAPFLRRGPSDPARTLLCRMVPFQATKPSAHQRTTDPLQAQSVRCAVLSPHRAIITWRDGERIENPKKAPVNQPTHARRGTGNAPGSHRLQVHAIPTHAQYKSGTDRHPVLTNVTPRPRRRPAVPTIKALASVPSAAPHQQTQHSPTTPCPRRADRPPGWPGTRIAADGRGRAGCGIRRLPWATTRQPRGGKS